MNNNAMRKQISALILFIVIATLGRLVPHPANMTPLMGLIVISSRYFNKKYLLLMIVMSLGFSDLLLSTARGYTVLGSWTLFTYTGFFIIALVSQKMLSTRNKLFEITLFTGISAFFYWIWTNLGTWLLSGMYAHSLAGLGECYVAAVPFLRNGLLGDLAWVCILSGLMRLIPHRNDNIKTMEFV